MEAALGCSGGSGPARLAWHRWKFCRLGLELATLPGVSSNSCFGNTALSLSIEIILCNVAGKGLICLLREKKEREEEAAESNRQLIQAEGPLWIRAARGRKKNI